jgi:hypothetical protein
MFDPGDSGPFRLPWRSSETSFQPAPAPLEREAWTDDEAQPWETELGTHATFETDSPFRDESPVEADSPFRDESPVEADSPFRDESPFLDSVSSEQDYQVAPGGSVVATSFGFPFRVDELHSYYGAGAGIPAADGTDEANFRAFMTLVYDRGSGGHFPLYSRAIRNHQAWHGAVDIPIPLSAVGKLSVRSIADGVVVGSTIDQNYSGPGNGGVIVVVRHVLPDGRSFLVRYVHLHNLLCTALTQAERDAIPKWSVMEKWSPQRLKDWTEELRYKPRIPVLRAGTVISRGQALGPLGFLHLGHHLHLEIISKDRFAGFEPCAARTRLETMPPAAANRFLSAHGHTQDAYWGRPHDPTDWRWYHPLHFIRRLQGAAPALPTPLPPTAPVQPPAPPRPTRTPASGSSGLLETLSPSELKAVRITSTFETNRPGGFGGLTGNFDGQGVSFGLLNFAWRAGSLVTLLQAFVQRHPGDFAAVFGADAATFREMVLATKTDANGRRVRDVDRQMHFARTVLNDASNHIREPWRTYFDRLEHNPAFKRIQVEAVRKAGFRARHWFDKFNLKTERGYAFMFDLVSSHGGWWLDAPKFGGRHERLLKAMLDRKRSSVARRDLSELETLEVIANMIADVSLPQFREMARVRKLWFVRGTGIVHKRHFDLAKDFGVTDAPPDFGAPSSHELMEPLEGVFEHELQELEEEPGAAPPEPEATFEPELDYEGTWPEPEVAFEAPEQPVELENERIIDLDAIRRQALELGEEEVPADEHHETEFEGQLAGSRPDTLPLVLAGPIVRRATTKEVWIWFACRDKVTACTPKLARMAFKGLDSAPTPIELARREARIEQLGERLWIVMVPAAPASGSFPLDELIGYDLEIDHDTGSRSLRSLLSAQGLGLAYSPFRLPTFFLSDTSPLVHGSCRRPGATATDAFTIYDRWLERRASEVRERPSALILTGDQIYADDVAPALFDALSKLAQDACGYMERLPLADQTVVPVNQFVSKRTFTFAKLQAAKGKLFHRKTLTASSDAPNALSQIGFSTEDGDEHLLSFAEFCSMYLLVWNPELCTRYGVTNSGAEGNAGLAEFHQAARAARRVLANTATYMIFDDHEITDDWNLDAAWETKTRQNPTAKRIIANGLAAYWAFQGWGNDPSGFDTSFTTAVTTYIKELLDSRGQSTPSASRFESALFSRHWSFVAPTTPPAVCVDTRTLRETEPGEHTSTLSGPRVWGKLKPLIRQHLGGRRQKPLLLVLPTPLLPHRILGPAQLSKGIDIDLVKLVTKQPLPITVTDAKNAHTRYAGDYELYTNQLLQRDELVTFLHYLIDPSALIIFSGDVHCGSVVNGLYVHGVNEDAIRAGNGEWGMRIAQVTSSPIKNQLPKSARSVVDALENRPTALDVATAMTPWPLRHIVGNPQFLAQVIDQKLRVPNRFIRTKQKTTLGLRVAEKNLNGDLGLLKTFIYEPHLCVVDIPSAADGKLAVTFVGVNARTGKEALATTTVSLGNKPELFKEPSSTFESAD